MDRARGRATGERAGAAGTAPRAGPAAGGAVARSAIGQPRGGGARDGAKRPRRGPGDGRPRADGAPPRPRVANFALEQDPTLLAAAAPKIAALPASAAADAFFVVAGADPAQSLAMNAAALALLGAARTGDPQHDRSLVVAEADALSALGRLQDAVVLLDHYVQLYPDEFTWDHAAANHLPDAGRDTEAEVRARAAMGKARGDQKLRAAMVLARALAGQGKRAQALVVLDSVLAGTPEPDAALEVRTHRYRKQVAELRAKIAGS